MMTHSLLAILPVGLFVFVLLFLLFRGLGRVWLDHSVRLALLEKIEKRPELLDPLQDLLDSPTGIRRRSFLSRQDYRVTGILLALMGVASCAAGTWLRTGRLAAGIYAGGFLCIGIAAILFAFGVIIRRLTARRPAIH